MIKLMDDVASELMKIMWVSNGILRFACIVDVVDHYSFLSVSAHAYEYTA